MDISERIVTNSGIVENIIGNLSTKDAWEVARSSRTLHRIVRESNAFWLSMINEIPDEVFPKAEVIRCFKIIRGVTARILFRNVWVMLCTNTSRESPAMPVSLRIPLITQEVHFNEFISKFWPNLSTDQQNTVFPALVDKIRIEIESNPSFIFRLSDDLQDWIVSSLDCLTKLEVSELATLALRYIKNEDALRYDQIYKCALNNDQEFCVGLILATLRMDKVSLEFLTHIFSLINRKKYSLEDIEIIPTAFKHENALELIELLVAKGAKAIPKPDQKMRPIYQYLFRQNNNSAINLEVIKDLEKRGDTYLEENPLIKAMVEGGGGKFNVYHASYLLQFTEENIDEKLCTYFPNDLFPTIPTMVTILLKVGFNVKHFVFFIERILTEEDFITSSTADLITIFEDLKKHGINLATWERKGKNLLHIMFEGRHWHSEKVAAYLLENKVDPLKKNVEGKIPLNLLLNKCTHILHFNRFISFGPVIQKMIELGVSLFDEKTPFTQFSEKETLWVAALLENKDFIYRGFTLKSIDDICIVLLLNDLELIKYLLGSIEFNYMTAINTNMSHFFDLIRIDELWNVEIFNLVLDKLYRDNKAHPFEGILTHALSSLRLLHDCERISTDTFIQFIKNIPTLYNPKRKQDELIWCINSTHSNVETSDNSFFIEDIEKFRAHLAQVSDEDKFVRCNTDIPLDNIIRSAYGFRLLLPIYEVNPDWFREEDIYTTLYERLVETQDPIIQNEMVGVCEELLRKCELSDRKKEQICFSTLFNMRYFSKICTGPLFLKQHLVKHFLTPESLQDKTRNYFYGVGKLSNLERLFYMLCVYMPTQEVWNMIKGVLESSSLDFVGKNNCRLIEKFTGFFKAYSETDHTVTCQILEYLWGKAGKGPTLSLHNLIENSKSSTTHIQYLVSIGHPVNHRDASNNTPLHIACNEGRLDIVKVLLENGADPCDEGENGETPWQIAKRSKNFELGLLLQNKFRGL